MRRDMDKELAPIVARMLDTLPRKVAPEHTALIVVDMQNDFCADGGFLQREGMNVKLVQAMTPRLVGFINKAREAGLPIVYIQTVYYAPGHQYISDAWLEHNWRRDKRRYREYVPLEQGSWGVEFYGGIKPLPGEIIVQKHRYGAFADTNLDLILRSKGIRTLIITGVATNCCVETTARDGFMKDYYIVFLKDCTAATAEDLHNSTIRNISLYFGEVVDSAEVVKSWANR